MLNDFGRSIALSHWRTIVPDGEVAPISSASAADSDSGGALDNVFPRASPMSTTRQPRTTMQFSTCAASRPATGPLQIMSKTIDPTGP